MSDPRELLYKKAHERALYLLGYRDHCYAELYQKLEKTYDEEIAAQTCDKMVELDLLNDARYAEKLSEHLITIKLFGLRKARWEMLHKGLARDLVEEALAPYEEEDATQRITELLECKYARYLTDERGVQKVINALARMGHQYSDIREAIARYMDEEQDFYE